MRLTVLTTWLLACLLSVSGLAQEPAAPAEPAPEPASEWAADITIFSSRTNQNVFEKANQDYRRGIKYWANAADKAGLSFRIAGDYELETGPARSKVYILHFLERLTPAQRKNLEELKSDGYSLIVVGLAGSADQDGQATPPSLAEEWFKLKDIRTYTPEKAAYLVPLPPSPFSMNIVPGRRFEFEWVGNYTMANSEHAVAANSDWELIPLPDAPTFSQNAFVTAFAEGDARYAWFGISPDAVVDTGDARAMFDGSMVHFLRWLAHAPAAAPCFWRGCAQSAAVITADVEDQFQTGDAIALACHKEGIKGSWFLVGKLAPDYPEVVAALAENGEVGTHSVTHDSFKDRPYEDQLRELSEGKQTLEGLGVKNVTGFRPPMEEYDYDTLRAVAQSGLHFIYGNLDYDRAFPVVREVDGKFIYQFARVVEDDYNLVTQRNVTNATEYQREYFKEFQRMNTLGGLFPFSFHTNYLALEESVDVVRAMVVRLKQENAWITTFGEISRWLDARRQVTLETTLEGSVTVLTVTNNAPTAIKAFPIRVYPPTENTQLQLIATPEDGLQLGPTTVEGAVVQVDLAPQETKVIKLR